MTFVLYFVLIDFQIGHQKSLKNGSLNICKGRFSTPSSTCLFAEIFTIECTESLILLLKDKISFDEFEIFYSDLLPLFQSQWFSQKIELLLM